MELKLSDDFQGSCAFVFTLALPVAFATGSAAAVAMLAPNFRQDSGRQSVRFFFRELFTRHAHFPTDSLASSSNKLIIGCVTR